MKAFAFLFGVCVLTVSLLGGCLAPITVHGQELDDLSIWGGASLLSAKMIIIEGSVGLSLSENHLIAVTAGYGTDGSTSLVLIPVEVSFMVRAIGEFHVGLGGGLMMGNAREQEIIFPTLNLKAGFRFGFIGLLIGLRVSQ